MSDLIFHGICSTWQWLSDPHLAAGSRVLDLSGHSRGWPVLSGTQSLLQAVAAGTSLHWPCSARAPFFLMGLAGRRQVPGAPLSFAVQRAHSETHAFYVKLRDFLSLLCLSEPLIEQSGFREQKGVGALFRPGLTSSVVLWPASALP